jgi:single-strand DNA-binding protein
MPNFNKVILAGHLTRDPEMRYTASGMAVTKFGIGTNHKYKDKSEVLFIDLTAFGKTAEAINQYCHKGDPLLVEGRLVLDQWEGKDGQKRSKIGAVVDGFQFLGGKRDRAESEPASAPAQATAPPQQAYEDPPPIGDGEVPF